MGLPVAEKALSRYQPMDIDLLHPEPAAEKRMHKLKRLIQGPNSYFMDVKCPGFLQITTVYSHAHGRPVRQLQRDALPADWRYCALDRGMQLPEEGRVGGLCQGSAPLFVKMFPLLI